jgi:DNA mismatch endonuclease (patch repair protein)
MVDVLTPEKRKFNMRRIRSKDTKPELLIRKALHARGLRYRLHDRSLPGKPDLVFKGYRIAVFVHGCFWHAHGCALSKLPGTRPDFWRDKLTMNAARDRAVVAALKEAGWRVLVIWECALRGPTRGSTTKAVDLGERFIRSTVCSFLEIGGAPSPD